MKNLAQLQQLQGKVIVVTGGSSGIGKSVAYEAASRGMIVIVLARHLDALETVRQECMALSHQPAYAIPLDVSDPDDIDRAVAQINAQVDQVDVLVNAAGFGVFENAFDVAPKTVAQMFKVNVLGLMYLSQKLGTQMVTNERGQIINISSMAGKMATPKSAVYSATKFAVRGYSDGLRLELRPAGVQVTAVYLGPVKTNFFTTADAGGDYLKQVDWIVLDPDRVAKRIVDSIGHEKRDINMPAVMEVAARFYQLFPHLGDWLAGGLFNRK
ncbi:SDR family NAD(P)-dependent oxidoreductase [Lactobacillus selangorensis]|nr:SDR family oxidoreductase [Lactobacillus selangorensis]